MPCRNAKAAVEEGIVAGGGVALLQSGSGAVDELKLDGDEATGANIVQVALVGPLKQIAFNAGLEPGVVAERSPTAAGVGLRTPPPVSTRTCSKAGVADPVKVTRSALQNAASIAALFLTTEAVSSPTSRKAAAPSVTRPVAWVAWTSSPSERKSPVPWKPQRAGLFVRLVDLLDLFSVTLRGLLHFAACR